MESLISSLQTMPLWIAIPALLLENAVILLLAIGWGEWVAWRYRDRRVSAPAPPLQRQEVLTAISSVVTCTIITVIGLFLWRWQIIRFRTDVGLGAWLDVVVLLLVMDLAMYFLHRLAHQPMFYSWLHRLHHDFDRPRPLTLFILNPLENLAFGSLWLIVISLYNASWMGMSIYLMLNVLFGTMGHLGVEPFPKWWGRIPVLRYIGGSSFHARHHQDLTCNYGFYTLAWDKLFGTLRKDYFESIGTVPDWVIDSTPITVDAMAASSSRADCHVRQVET